ncbi:MAG: alpha/beta hydrolase family protein, partial [Psychrobium sp.]
MNRYGFPGHLEPWCQFNPVEVDFIRIYKALHEAGYNVLTYDMRNSGRSGEAHGGVASVGLTEWRDVTGAMEYVANHPQLMHMKVGLFNPCAGGNAAMVAMTKRPELFKDVKAFVCPQPCSMDISMKELATLQGVGEFMEELDDELVRLGSYRTCEMSPHHYAQSVTMPTFIIQVKDDIWTKPIDVQTTFNLLVNVADDDKQLSWIENTQQRFDGYNYFGDNPSPMLDFFNRYFE